jgi:hypothetical protein
MLTDFMNVRDMGNMSCVCKEFYGIHKQHLLNVEESYLPIMYYMSHASYFYSWRKTMKLSIKEYIKIADIGRAIESITADGRCIMMTPHIINFYKWRKTVSDIRFPNLRFYWNENRNYTKICIGRIPEDSYPKIAKYMTVIEVRLTYIQLQNIVKELDERLTIENKRYKKILKIAIDFHLKVKDLVSVRTFGMRRLLQHYPKVREFVRNIIQPNISNHELNKIVYNTTSYKQHYNYYGERSEMY